MCPCVRTYVSVTSVGGDVYLAPRCWFLVLLGPPSDWIECSFAATCGIRSTEYISNNHLMSKLHKQGSHSLCAFFNFNFFFWVSEGCLVSFFFCLPVSRSLFSPSPWVVGLPPRGLALSLQLLAIADWHLTPVAHQRLLKSWLNLASTGLLSHDQ